MTIKNSTKWSTSDLRLFFRRCIKEVEKVEKPNYPFHKRNKNFQLDILNSNNVDMNGRATIEGYWIMFRIPLIWKKKIEMPTKDDAKIVDGKYQFKGVTDKMSWVTLKDPSKIKDYPHYWKITGEINEMELKHKKRMAQVIIHEYYHTIGYKHQDRRRYTADFTKQFNVDWVKDYQIREKEIIKKLKVDIKLQRYQQSIANFRKAETRLKRAKTLYKKWQVKVKYYEKTYGSK